MVTATKGKTVAIKLRKILLSCWWNGLVQDVDGTHPVHLVDVEGDPHREGLGTRLVERHLAGHDETVVVLEQVGGGDLGEVEPLLFCAEEHRLIQYEASLARCFGRCLHDVLLDVVVDVRHGVLVLGGLLLRVCLFGGNARIGVDGHQFFTSFLLHQQ